MGLLYFLVLENRAHFQTAMLVLDADFSHQSRPIIVGVLVGASCSGRARFGVNNAPPSTKVSWVLCIHRRIVSVPSQLPCIRKPRWVQFIRTIISEDAHERSPFGDYSLMDGLKYEGGDEECTHANLNCK